MAFQRSEHDLGNWRFFWTLSFLIASPPIAVSASLALATMSVTAVFSLCFFLCLSSGPPTNRSPVVLVCECGLGRSSYQSRLTTTAPTLLSFCTNWTTGLPRNCRPWCQILTASRSAVEGPWGSGVEHTATHEMEPLLVSSQPLFLLGKSSPGGAGGSSCYFEVWPVQNVVYWFNCMT